MLAYYDLHAPSEDRARHTFMELYPGVELLGISKSTKSNEVVDYHFRYRRAGSQLTETTTVHYSKYPEGGWIEISGRLPDIAAPR